MGNSFRIRVVVSASELPYPFLVQKCVTGGLWHRIDRFETRDEAMDFADRLAENLKGYKDGEVLWGQQIV